MSQTKRIDFDGCAVGTYVAVLSWRAPDHARDPITWVDWKLYEVVAVYDDEPDAPLPLP